VADFTVIAYVGLTVVDWLDPPNAGGQPSRLNARQDVPLKRYVGTVGIPVALAAVVGGVVAPVDAALGGRLFTACAIEAPVMPFSGMVSPPGWSSVVIVTPDHIGHFTIRIRRPDGGNEHIHMDIG